MKKLLLITLALFVVPAQAINLEQAKITFKTYARFLPFVGFGFYNVYQNIQKFNELTSLGYMFNGLTKWQENRLFKETEQNKKQREDFFNSSTYEKLTSYLKREYSDINISFKNKSIHQNNGFIKVTKKNITQDFKLALAESDVLLQKTDSLILLGYIIYKKSPLISKLSGLILSAWSGYNLINGECKDVSFQTYRDIGIILGALGAYFG